MPAWTMPSPRHVGSRVAAPPAALSVSRPHPPEHAGSLWPRAPTLTPFSGLSASFSNVGEYPSSSWGFVAVGSFQGKEREPSGVRPQKLSQCPGREVLSLDENAGPAPYGFVKRSRLTMQRSSTESRTADVSSRCVLVEIDDGT